mmetsp:Transcript_66756/g.159665  ORF Transcript_66756/g.159665 Transcript_66756/m.159665 type:complete len:433 (+) Transcript_66756:135-1433(+)
MVKDVVLPLMVKNTFIDVDKQIFDDDDAEDGFSAWQNIKRQYSAPPQIGTQMAFAAPCVTYTGCVPFQPAQPQQYMYGWEGAVQEPEKEPHTEKSGESASASSRGDDDFCSQNDANGLQRMVTGGVQYQDWVPAQNMAMEMPWGWMPMQGGWADASMGASGIVLVPQPVEQEVAQEAPKIQQNVPVPLSPGAQILQALQGGGRDDDADRHKGSYHEYGSNRNTAGILPDECWPEGVNSVSPDMQNCYTVMMRNLPNKYSQQMLLEEIREAGFTGAFDFFYLPVDMQTNANKGYAFVNFINPGWSELFKRQFDAKRMRRFNSSKHVSVVPATLQGFDANYEHYSSARVSRGDPCARPLFLREPNRKLGRKPVKRKGNSSIDAAAAGKQPQVPTEQHTINFCPYCGAKVNQGFIFCQNCGKSLRAEYRGTSLGE